MKNEIVLVRHATTTETRAGLLSDDGPIPLDDRGRRQAEAIGSRLAPRSFEQVIVSPVARAWETAARAGLADGAETDEALVEWHYGEFVGRVAAHVREEIPSWDLWTQGAPGGESPDEVTERLRPVLSRLLAADGDIAVVSHGHVLRALVVGWMSIPLASAGSLVIDPASISVLGHRHGRPALVVLNDRSHLADGDE